MRSADAHGGGDLTVLVDRSGSMHPLADTVVTEVNQLIDTVTIDDPTALVTIIAFNSIDPFDLLVDRAGGLHVSTLSRRSYQPNGNTPLYDAIGHALRWVGDRFGGNRDDARIERRVQFAVVTDGRENVSKDFTEIDVAGMIERRRARGWEFSYLGVADAMRDARLLGFERDEIELWEANPEGTRRAFTSITDRAMRRRPSRRPVSDRWAGPEHPASRRGRQLGHNGSFEAGREEA